LAQALLLAAAMQKPSLSSLLAAVAFVSIGTVPLKATSYDFDVTYNGTSASADVGSDPLVGTVLAVGDSFRLDIHAADTDFWSVNTAGLQFLDATFQVQEGAVRTGNIKTTLFLDGAQVDQGIQNNIGQAFVHIGNQTFNWQNPTLFDQVVVEYDFLSISTPTTTTLIGIGFQPFYQSSYITYNEGAAPVPDAGSTATLLGLSVACIAYARREKRS
jgi:hypothetical protein